MKKKALILGGAAVIAAAGIFYGLFGRGGDTAEYETRPTVSVEKPGKGDIILYTDLTGVIEARSSAAVQPKMGGEVLEVYFQAGDMVEAGQALCRIDTDALTALKLQMDAAAVSLRNAENSLTRTRALYAGGYVSQQDMEQAENGHENARIAYDTAKNQYDLQVEHTTVTAPISGIVESRTVEPHAHVGTNTVICAISGGEGLQVKFGITEKILSNLSAGDTIEIEKNGTSYEAKVMEIGTMVNSAAGLYDVKAAIPESKGLTTGTRVKLTVVMNRAENVMTIPVDAVSYDGGVPFVFCYEDGIAKKTEIESGIYDARIMEVTAGLTENSAVITSWSNELQDGVEVLTEESVNEEAAPEDSARESSSQADASDNNGVHDGQVKIDG